VVVLALVIVGATAFGALSRGAGAPRTRRGWARHPGVWLLVVTGLVYLNQVLFTVHVMRVWGGDVSRVARYLPDGWFALADLGWVADRFPAPELLSWTVLRAQAFLELPFVVLAYLTVCRWFGADVYRRAVHARWAVSASYTVTFCLVEWSLWNPYTVGDVVVRSVSGVVVPLLVTRLGEGEEGPPRLVPFVASLAAVGVLVLVVYDSALLYNLGHLPGWLPVVGGAGLVLAVARWRARGAAAAGGPAIGAVTRSLGWFLVIFFVPALPLRYGMNFGIAGVSLAAGVVIVVAALWLGWPRDLVGTLLVAIGVGVGGAAVGYLVARGFPEARLLAAAAGFLLAGAGACVASDRVAA
jgi:hypothetical protein